MNGRTLVVALYFLATGIVCTLAFQHHVPAFVGVVIAALPVWLGGIVAGFAMIQFAIRKRYERRDEDGAWRRGYREGRRDEKVVHTDFKKESVLRS